MFVNQWAGKFPTVIVFFRLLFGAVAACAKAKRALTILFDANRLLKKGIPVSQSPEVSANSAKTGNFIEINAERCKGCYLCITACPHDLIEKSDRLNAAGCYPARPAETARFRCTACGLCWQMCPDSAIEVFKADKEGKA